MEKYKTVNINRLCMLGEEMMGSYVLYFAIKVRYQIIVLIVHDIFHGDYNLAFTLILYVLLNSYSGFM